jgi:hypothetical protein
MKAEQYICYARHSAIDPESKVARLAQLCASRWVQGSPLPPAAQAIICVIFHYHFLDSFFRPID